MKTLEALSFLGITSQDVLPDYNIDYVSKPKLKVHNSMLIIENLQVEHEIADNSLDQCLIITNHAIDPIRVISNNIIISSNNICETYAKLVYKFNVRKVFDASASTEYKQILKSSKVVSKSAVIYNSIIGQGCAFHHNVMIGIDGLQRIIDSQFIMPQLGGVEIGDNVSIYSNTIVNRGTIDNTIIGDNTKIDSFCRIGHDVKIGKNCIIESGVIIAPNITIGDNVEIQQGCQIVHDLPDGMRINNHNII